jgi:two-component system, chemotaxis family, response regulator Rcp1
MNARRRTATILMVEDDEGDVRLTREALRDGKLVNELHVVGDGESALAFLRREGPYADAPRPDLVLLDLNLPRMTGHEVLAELRADPRLHTIPVTVLTTSSRDEDVVRSYELHVNAYVTKPVGLDEFLHVVREIEDFWFELVRIPESAR